MSYPVFQFNQLGILLA